jgi:hypothetical protein
MSYKIQTFVNQRSERGFESEPFDLHIYVLFSFIEKNYSLITSDVWTHALSNVKN